MIVAIMMVRNESDILAVNVLHHLAIGVDRVLVVDHDSSDGTADLLHRLGRRLPVRAIHYQGPYDKRRVLTELAHEAFLQGADWVLPTDADEFWWAPTLPLPDVLAASSAGALAAGVVNFVQRREEETPGPASLLTMTRRVAEPVAIETWTGELLDSRGVAVVETDFTSPKIIARASLKLAIAHGAHHVMHADGPVEATEQVICLHAPLRAKSLLQAKAEALVERVHDVPPDDSVSWHRRRWRQLLSEGLLDAEWAANSYAADGLDVYGVRRPLVFDPTLRDLMAPLVEQAQRENVWPERAEAGPTAASEEDRELEEARFRLSRYERGLAGLRSEIDRLTEETDMLRQELDRRERVLLSLHASRAWRAAERYRGARSALERAWRRLMAYRVMA